jgi:hypothetical protein
MIRWKIKNIYQWTVAYFYKVVTKEEFLYIVKRIIKM